MTKLKDFFDEGVVRSLARDFGHAYPKFDQRTFTRTCLSGLDELELTARGRHIAEALRSQLPSSFEKAAAIIVRSLGPELESSDEFGMAPFRYLPHVFFVARYGLDHFEAAMAAQLELTKRFSAEYSIRLFLERHPAETLARLRRWAGDRNVHVRRLVSEGTRPRLPWAPRLRDFQQDPRPVLELLELLKDDRERYVQRSVANNLNDISKDHPDAALAVCRRWLRNAPPARRWIVQHALRTLVKAANPGALALLGFGHGPEVDIVHPRLAARSVRQGDSLGFSCKLVSTASSSQRLLVDYVVHFVKANGETRPKVFKLKKLVLAPSESVSLQGKVSFADMTTRRHYPGRHRIELLLNGIARPLGEFRLRPSSD